MADFIAGTTRLFDSHGESVIGSNAIVLVPAPTTDPCDPLRWSDGRKRVHLACVLWYTFVAAMCAAGLNSLLPVMQDSTDLTLDEFVVGLGYTYWAIGLSALISQPLALAFGKRPVYISHIFAATLLNWIARSLLLGFTSGPSFCLAEVSLADIFFLHQRALPIGLYVFVLYSGALLAPMLSGFIYEGLNSWYAVVWFQVGLSGMTALVLFLFMEETNFVREQGHSEINVTSTLEARDHIRDSSPVEGTSRDTKFDSKDTNPSVAIADTAAFVPSPWPGLAIKQSIKMSPHAWGIMWRGAVQPFAMLRLPIVWWCAIMYGMYQVYFNLIGSFTASILTLPPYNMSLGTSGLAFLSPFLGCIPGAVSGGWLADWVTIRSARRNGGIAEAEHKLKLFAIPAIALPIGFLMMGLGIFYEAHFMVYIVGLGIMNIAGPFATLLAITYAFDCFHLIEPKSKQGVQATAHEGAPYITSIIFTAMCITFAFSYAITNWSFNWGFLNWTISIVLGATALNASTWLLFRYGKWLRRSGESYYTKVINW